MSHGCPAFPSVIPFGQGDWKVIDAHVMFVPNEKGQVVKAIHRQAGEVIEAPKLC